MKGVEVNENVSWGCNAATNYGRENLLGYLIRQCMRRAVPRVVGRVRIFRQAAGAVRFLHGFGKLLKFATLVATVVFVARKDIFLFPKVVEAQQPFCLFFRNAAIKIQKILSSLHVE
ncbi:MAG TPA: hypothetical protein IAB15_00600 [Candidatus Ornithoclostridium faecigallinarum]|nr:hypothetical protein [Candidatus Ornithoclostridium faecigallinarum]